MGQTEILAIFVLMMSLCIWKIECSVHEYWHAPFTPQGNAYVFFGGSEGMYAGSAGESKPGVSNGQSYIRFDHSVTFRRPSYAASKYQQMEHSTGLVEAVIFDVADRDKLGGSAYGGQLALCCTPDMARDVGCQQGQVIIRPSADDWPYSIKTTFQGNSTEAKMDMHEVKVTKSGMYILYFIYCDPQLEGLVVDGKSIWKNPAGYLPGRMQPFMGFYGFMSLAYLILGLVWFFQNVRFWRDILMLQNCITVIIGLGMAEMALWYFDYVNFNTRGSRPVGITIWAVSVGAVKKTVSRLLILAVSMGYGVVRPTLGGLTSKVLLLGGTYFLASESLDIVEHVGRIDELSNKARLILVLPVAILDAFFILWIFTSLSKTLEKLQTRKLPAKLELYRRFTNALALAVLTSVGWIGYELYFKASDTFGEHWQNAWIVSAFWNILTFGLLCVICTLWGPSQNSMRYAYSEDAGDNFDDDEIIGLTTNVNGKSFEVEKPSIKAEKKDKLEKKEKKNVNSAVFSLDDDVEEDKRE